MAGNIPPLVSSTPPPLNAFDDDEEEEEEDEFGLYNTAEDIAYNECISFKEKDEEKQNVSKSRGEQDSTSQDSATDSGLCPDSEGMSPTPHSDEERTLKQTSCDKLCQSTGELSDCQETVSVNHETVPCPNLPNGHAKEGHCGQESDDDFGNFEFAPSQRVQSAVEESFREDVSISQSLSSTQQCTEGDHNVGNISNIHLYHDQFTEKVENNEKRLSEFCLLESTLNGLVVKDTDCTPSLEETCKYKQSNMQYNEFTIEKLDIASSNDSSSFNSVDSSLEPKDVTSSQCQKIEQHDIDSVEKTSKEDHEDGLKSTMENFDYREEKEIEIPVENGEDDEFDDFADFKAELPGCDDLSRSEQSDKFNEHSKILIDQTKLGEAALSLPPLHQEESDDEFSNFADFSSSDCAFVSAQSSNSLENVSHIPLKLDDSDLRTESEFQDWVSVFPCEDGETPLVATALLRQDDVVWSRLFPLESSPALSYQWIESLANRRLLTALNIDSRNIESVPDAHFDWVGSGLTNPLDCPKTVLNLPKTLCAEADNILSSLPDISFMRKTYIDFPIGDA